MWNTEVLAAGAELTWNVTTQKKVSSLAHDATLDAFEPLHVEGAKPDVAPPRATSAATAESRTQPVAEARPSTQSAGSSDAPIRLSSPSQVGRQSALLDGTTLRTRLMKTLSSAQAREGDTVQFEVMEDVRVSDATIIARGATAIGTVTDAISKRSMGRAGHLDVTIDYVRSVSGEKIRLRGVQNSQAGGHVGAVTGAIIATSIVFFPAAPLFLFMKGKDATIPKGHEVEMYVDGDYPVISYISPVLEPKPELPKTDVSISRPFKSGKAMTNEDVLILRKAGFGDEFIITKIKASPPGFILDSTDLVKLKQEGLSESVIGAMIQQAGADK
jgi:hypothetical protein